MQLGYNHNIRHKGKLYHIQTEDSGKATMHITTLLYTGGTILASKKTSYKNLREKGGDYKQELQGLMKNQHKLMLIDLKNGLYDDEEQAKIKETKKEKKEEDKTILDAIKSIEEKRLHKIIAEGEMKKKANAERGKVIQKSPEIVKPQQLKAKQAPSKPVEPQMKKQAIPVITMEETKAKPVVKNMQADIKKTLAAKEAAEKRSPINQAISEKSLDDVILNFLSDKLKKNQKERL